MKAGCMDRIQYRLMNLVYVIIFICPGICFWLVFFGFINGNEHIIRIP